MRIFITINYIRLHSKNLKARDFETFLLEKKKGLFSLFIFSFQYYLFRFIGQQNARDQ